MVQALYPSHSVSPRGAASASSPLPATIPWMVSCILCHGIFRPLSWCSWAIFATQTQVQLLDCKGAPLGPLIVEYKLAIMEYEKVIPWITSLTSWDLWPFIYATFTKLCDCLLPACTLDHHFVFSVPAALVDPPISPAMLFTLGNATCKPERVTSDYALFKIPMDGCGAHKIVSCGGGKPVLTIWPHAM